MTQQRVVGQPCPDCGGKFVKNPKTGKVFCENKCWLKKQEPEPVIQLDAEPKPVRDFAAENFGKCKYGFLLEAFKQDKILEDIEIECERWAKAALRNISNQSPEDKDQIPF